MHFVMVINRNVHSGFPTQIPWLKKNERKNSNIYPKRTDIINHIEDHLQIPLIHESNQTEVRLADLGSPYFICTSFDLERLEETSSHNNQ